MAIILKRFSKTSIRIEYKSSMHKILIFVSQLSLGINQVLTKRDKIVLSGCLKLKLREYFMFNRKNRRHFGLSMMRPEMHTMTDKRFAMISFKNENYKISQKV